MQSQSFGVQYKQECLTS